MPTCSSSSSPTKAAGRPGSGRWRSEYSAVRKPRSEVRTTSGSEIPSTPSRTQRSSCGNPLDVDDELHDSAARSRSNCRPGPASASSRRRPAAATPNGRAQRSARRPASSSTALRSRGRAPARGAARSASRSRGHRHHHDDDCSDHERPRRQSGSAARRPLDALHGCAREHRGPCRSPGPLARRPGRRRPHGQPDRPAERDHGQRAGRRSRRRSPLERGGACRAVGRVRRRATSQAARPTGTDARAASDSATSAVGRSASTCRVTVSERARRLPPVRRPSDRRGGRREDPGRAARRRSGRADRRRPSARRARTSGQRISAGASCAVTSLRAVPRNVERPEPDDVGGGDGDGDHGDDEDEPPGPRLDTGLPRSRVLGRDQHRLLAEEPGERGQTREREQRRRRHGPNVTGMARRSPPMSRHAGSSPRRGSPRRRARNSSALKKACVSRWNDRGLSRARRPAPPPCRRAG